MLYEALHNTLSSYFRIQPITLALLVTERCNAKCIMCNIWREGISSGSELTLKQYEALFAHPFFDRISVAMISGGEVYIRPDFVEIAQVLLDHLPRLRRITITTNGLGTDLITSKTKEMLKRLQASPRTARVRLGIQVSYDGISEVHDRIRGPDAHRKATRTLENLMVLREHYPRLSLSAGCVIQPLNLHEIDAVARYLKQNHISSIFPVVCEDPLFFKNEEASQIRFSEAQLEEAKDLLWKLSREEPHPGVKFLYRDLRNILSGKPNSRGCPTLRDTITIEPNGNVVPCINSRNRLLGNVLTDDLNDIWFSKRTRQSVRRINREKCKSCLFACGMSYREVLKYTVLDGWEG